MTLTYKGNRVYLADIKEICQAHDVQIVQHYQTRVFTLILSTGESGWVINSLTGNAITKISELTLSQWCDQILITKREIISSVKK